MAKLLHIARQIWQLGRFRTSGEYWDERYRLGGTSGAGSHGAVARFKADFMNRFVRENDVITVLELGCGDGAQLELAEYPNYMGLDVSRTAVARCQDRFADDHSKFFACYRSEDSAVLPNFLSADLTLSQDVIYHLVEDDVYEAYIELMFAASRRFAVFFSSDREERTRWPHVRHRNFTRYAAETFPNFELVHVEKNPHQDESFADFYVYQRHGF